MKISVSRNGDPRDTEHLATPLTSRALLFVEDLLQLPFRSHFYGFPLQKDPCCVVYLTLFLFAALLACCHQMRLRHGNTKTQELLCLYFPTATLKTNHSDTLFFVESNQYLLTGITVQSTFVFQIGMKVKVGRFLLAQGLQGISTTDISIIAQYFWIYTDRRYVYIYIYTIIFILEFYKHLMLVCWNTPWNVWAVRRQANKSSDKAWPLPTTTQSPRTAETSNGHHKVSYGSCFWKMQEQICLIF